jgi:ATP-dependent Clp protease adaptor protein ClpS
MSKIAHLHLTLNQRDGEQTDVGYEQDLALAEVREELQPPPMYSVIMLDDDFTPMDFVVEVLQQIFHLPTEKATQIMLTVHTKGQAVCGTYTKDIAETKTAQVNRLAREHQHPLLCEVKQAEP